MKFAVCIRRSEHYIIEVEAENEEEIREGPLEVELDWQQSPDALDPQEEILVIQPSQPEKDWFGIDFQKIRSSLHQVQRGGQEQ